MKTGDGRARYGMKFSNWLAIREGLVGAGGDNRQSGRGRGAPLLNLPQVRRERFNTYVSMRLFTSPSGRVLPRHLSPTTPWRAPRLRTPARLKSRLLGASRGSAS